MKDKNDSKTGELLAQPQQESRGVGRPKQYASAAARQKAYRERLKAVVAPCLTPDSYTQAPAKPALRLALRGFSFSKSTFRTAEAEKH